MSSYGELFDKGMPAPALYSVEPEDPTDAKGAVIYIWDEVGIVPLDVIRSVCENLGIDPDVLDTVN